MSTHDPSDPRHHAERARSLFGMDEAEVRASAERAPSLQWYVSQQVADAMRDVAAGEPDAARQAMNRAKRVLSMLGGDASAWHARRRDGEAGTAGMAVESLYGVQPRNLGPDAFLMSLLSDAQESLERDRSGAMRDVVKQLATIHTLCGALWGDCRGSETAAVDWPATIARDGSVSIYNGLSSTSGNRDASEWTIEVSAGAVQRVIATTVHDDELNAEVGGTLAQYLRELVRDGHYVTRLNPVEVMGIRGRLLSRLNEAEWARDPGDPWRGPTVPINPAELPTVVVCVQGGFAQSAFSDTPVRIVIADADSAHDAELDNLAEIDGTGYDVSSYTIARPIELAHGRRVIDKAARVVSQTADLIDQIVQKVCEEYDFGPGAELEAWGQSETEETATGVIVRRVCYIEFDADPETERYDGSEKATLQVEIVRPLMPAGSWSAVGATCLLVSNGGEIGRWPADKAAPSAPTPGA